MTANAPDASGLEIKPLRGLRYSTERVTGLASVTAPPYDLIGAGDAERLMSADPYNVVRLIRPRDANDEQPYRQAGALLERWRQEGVLVADNAPALYVYEQRRRGAVLQRGLIGAVRLARPEAGIVLPHEDTMPGPIADRLALTRATSANLEPILLLYEGDDARPSGEAQHQRRPQPDGQDPPGEIHGRGEASTLVDEIAASQPPACRAATNSGEEHLLWRITDPAAQLRIARDLRDRTALIADGHHRYASYLRFQRERHAAGDGDGPWDYGLALLVDSTAHPPHLGAVHRVLGHLPFAAASEQASDVGKVARLRGSLDDAVAALARASERGPAFLLDDGSSENGFHLLTDLDPASLTRAMPSGHSPTWRRLAASVLHRFLIPEVWNIHDEQRAVAFYHDATDARTAAARSGGTAVLLPPIPVPDVLALAAAGERVPRKSTSFGPKPRTGLILRALDDRP